MNKISWGIIGLGSIAHKFAQACQVVDTATLSGVASRNKEKSETFGEAFSLSSDQCYGSYDELLNNPHIDAIYIALPNNLHKEWSIKALNAKKAVLCEKPSVLNSTELEEVLAAASTNQQFYMEAMKTRFLPITQHVKALLSQKVLGDIHLVYGDFGFKAPFDPNNRLFDPAYGGGALLDVGVYPLAYTLDLFGNDTQMIDHIQTNGETGVDIDTSILLKSKDHTHIHLFASITCDSPRDYVIVGSKGSLRIPKFSNAISCYLTQDGDTTHTLSNHLANGLEYQIMEVNRCLHDNKLESDIMSWDDSRQLMHLVDAIAHHQ